MKGDGKRSIPAMPNYEEMILRKEIRSKEDCNCFISKTARSPVQMNSLRMKGRGNKIASITFCKEKRNVSVQ